MMLQVLDYLVTIAWPPLQTFWQRICIFPIILGRDPPEVKAGPGSSHTQGADIVEKSGICSNSRIHQRAGAAIVELAIVLPVLVLILIGTVQLGRLLSQIVWTANNNYEAVRTGAETVPDFSDEAMRNVFDNVIRENYLDSGVTRASNNLNSTSYEPDPALRSVSASSSGFADRLFNFLDLDFQASYTGPILLSNPNLEEGELDQFENSGCSPCGGSECYYDCDGNCVENPPLVPCEGIEGTPVPSCFSGDTAVLMADGTQKPIKAVKEGDLVTAFDFERGLQAPARVTGKIRKLVSSYLLVNGFLRVTEKHRFFVPSSGNWKAAEHLLQGDKLRTFIGQEPAVTSVQRLKKSLIVYNLTVERYHNYYAGGFLVHNRKIGNIAILMGD